MKLIAAPILASAIGLAGCTDLDIRKRWGLSGNRIIVFKPICAGYRAPSLGNSMPKEGLVPAFLFSIDGASAEVVAKLRKDLGANGFAIGEINVNYTQIVFGAGKGVLRTQRMADRLYLAMCRLQRRHVRLVHVRYNHISEASRII